MNILKKILYRGIPVTEYASVTSQEPVSEKVFLKINDTTIDVSQDHWPLCLKPVTFGIWLRKGSSVSLSQNNTYTLRFEGKVDNTYKKLSEAKLHYVSDIREQDGTLLIVRLTSCKLYHTSFLEQLFLFFRYYRKPGFSFSTFKSYVTTFSYPRKVRIISFQAEMYYNIFPMDFVGNPGGTNRFVFGLRYTNPASQEIRDEKKLVVCEVPAMRKEDIYRLGANHNSVPPPKDKLSFKTIHSRNFGFPVPDWAGSYQEIRITHYEDLGSHMLFWGESIHTEPLKPVTDTLYHIHFLLHLFRKRHLLS
jgi:hypothetical protein